MDGDRKTNAAFAKVAALGLGLIGASLAQAMLDRGLALEVVACDANFRALQTAQEEGLIVEGFDCPKKMLLAHTDVDLLILAIPTQATAEILPVLVDLKTKGALKNAIVCDVASTKQNVLRSLKIACQRADKPLDFLNFVPSHPIAGAEKSGVLARRGDLFVDHPFIVCQEDDPGQQSATPDAFLAIAKLWRDLGAQPRFMNAAQHDAILAYTSHLPHLLAANLTHQLASRDDNLEIFRYAAGGFRDYSRIAASSPAMWRDIFLANKDALLLALDEHNASLDRLRRLVEDEKSDELMDFLLRAQNARRHFGHMLDAQNAAAFSSTPAQGKIMQYCVRPSAEISGCIRVASDKSISHRAIMLGSLADGVTRVENFLQGEDALSTLQAFCDMGVSIERQGGSVRIQGVGIDGLKAPKRPLDMGNSGTSMRLLAGILAAQPFDSALIGDASLSKRPMERVAKPLRQMGANVQTTGEKGTPPISIFGNPHLQSIDYAMPVASAQVKSCLLLAGLWAKGTTCVREPEITRDHTERMLRAFSYPVSRQANAIAVEGGKRLVACDICVPADISSAAFFMVAAAIAKKGEITLQDVGINPSRVGVIEILRLMGADIELVNERAAGGEPIADIVVRASTLRGIEIPPRLVPLAIDEFPALFVAASCAIGQTKLTGAKELRVKESDRILAMAEGLTALGVRCQTLEDGIVIEGKGKEGQKDAVFSGGRVVCHHDHRIAMSFAVASVRAAEPICVVGVEAVATSFPNFTQLAQQVGIDLSEQTSDTKNAADTQ